MDSLVKCLDKKDFKYLCQDFDGNVLGLVKQKRFYSYEYIGNFERFKEELPNKETFYKFETKTMKDYHDLYLKYNATLLAVFEKFRNTSLYKFRNTS